MSAQRTHLYRFATRGQWERCLLDRFDQRTDGGLVPAVPLGLHAVQVTKRGPMSTVAVDPFGAPLWRLGEGGSARLQWRDELGETIGPFEIDETFAASPRWIVDRDWLWAFCRQPARLRRYGRYSLQLDLTIDIDDLRDAVEDEAYALPVSILDIAADGKEGIWALVRSANNIDWVEHFDCEGCLRDRRRASCECGSLAQIGSVYRGTSLVLLPSDGTRLWFMKVGERGTPCAVHFTDLAPCWSASRLATDSRNRIALSGAAFERWSLIVLDGSGNLLDGPFEKLFDDEGALDTRDTPTPAPAPIPIPKDLAVGGGVIWFAMADGLWRLDATAEAGTRETECSLLTPRLESPPTAGNRGWLRAEISINLPRGAVLIVEYGSTDDENLATRLNEFAANPLVTARGKQLSIWSYLDPPSGRRFVVAGPITPGVLVAVPLFESQQRWLWLRLTVVNPPGTAPGNLTELRVLYPDVSLVQYLPAIFRGEVNDPGGFLRGLVGALESTTQPIDEKIRGIGRNIDPETAPDDWLDFLGSWLDLPWDEGLPAKSKRCLLRHAGDLLKWRGTRAGLIQLLKCILEPGGSAAIVDLTVDHRPLRLGGRGGAGGTLPALLAGASPRAAVLGAKAVLGRARLSCGQDDCDPLRTIVPTILIEISATRATRLALQPLLAGILGQYLPAGLKKSINWRTVPHLPSAASNSDGLILDANGPGTLGVDSLIGRTLLGGRAKGRIDETGLGVGFRL